VNPFDPGESDHGYIEGAPYSLIAAQWDPEEIDRTEHYWPYERGLGGDRARQSGTRSQTGREEHAAPPHAAAPAPIPGPHLDPDFITDPEGSTHD
jgi:hypothetical protein